MAMTRAEMNKRYFTSTKGRMALRRALTKYRQKNSDHDFNSHKEYNGAELAVFDLVIDKRITVSEAAVILGRTAGAVANKLHRIRKERGYI